MTFRITINIFCTLTLIKYHINWCTVITNKKIIGPVINLDSFSGAKEFKGKIVVIEKADPGYDWIFGHQIAGLITKYGGVASHMAIRAAEFGLPSAIGCGELIFNQITKAKMVELNCSTRQIHIIEKDL